MRIWKLCLFLLFIIPLSVFADEDILIDKDITKIPFTFKTGAPGHLFFEGKNVTVRMEFDGAKGDYPYGLSVSVFNDRNESVYKTEFAVPDKKNPVIKNKIGKMVPGYYTYLVNLEYSKGKPKQAFLKFGVIRKPGKKAPPEKNPFAVDAFMSWRCSSGEKIRKASVIMKRIGIDWVRDRIAWNHTQPEEKKWDWSKYEEAQKIQSEEGLKILQILHDTAIWASSEKEGSNSFRQKFPPSDTFDFYKYTKKASDHFSKNVQAWELWNEFDIPVFFQGSADEYARVLKAGYLGVKKGNPEAEVLFGSITLGSGEIAWGNETYFDKEGRRYIEKVFENGGGEYFDIYNVHHYGPVEGVVSKIRVCREIMNKHGYDKPIWLTEMGSTATDKMKVKVDEKEVKQSYYLVKAYCLAFSEGVEKFFYFSLPDFIEHESSFWGILEESGDAWFVKPAFVALANLINTLDGLTYYGKYETYKPVEALIFSKGSEACMVLWSRDGKDHKISLYFNDAQEMLTLRKIYGQELFREKLLGASMKVGNEPIFIRNFDLYDLDEMHIIKKEKYEVATDKKPKDIIKDTWVEIRSDVKNPGIDSKKITGEIRVCNLSPDTKKGDLYLYSISLDKREKLLWKKSVSVPENSSRNVKFEIPLSFEILKNLASNPGAELSVKSYFETANGFKTLPAIRYFAFQPPVEIPGISMVDSLKEDAECSVTVKNISEKSREMNVSFEASGNFSCKSPAVKIKLEKDEVRVLSYKLSSRLENPGKFGKSPARITVQSGDLSISRKGFIELDSIAKSFAPFKIDGKGNGWEPFQPFSLEGRENFVHGTDLLKGEGDVRASLYTAWDENQLYIFCVVEDDAVTNPFRKVNPWTGDALEIFIDVREGEDFGKAAYGPGVFHIFAVPPDTGNPDPLLMNWPLELKQFKDVQIASIVKEGAWSMEIAIPWKNLTDSKIKAGRKIAFEITIDDIDPGDYSHRQMIWRGSPNNWRDASQFSTLKLVSRQGICF
jgi:cellulose/xylan binding protein with CBM9 domain/putative glycosyl hydrolase